MGRWLIFSTLFLVSVSFATEKEQDVEELEALIEGRPPQERKPAAKAPAKDSFYKSFGNDMSIRGDGKYFYIKAKDTVITVDASGHVQIEAADNILMKSKRSITLQADENIYLVSGEGVVQSKLDQKKLSEETPKLEETEKEASKEPAAQPPPKAKAAEEESAEIEKKKVQEPSTALETEESEVLEESETESGSENE